MDFPHDELDEIMKKQVKNYYQTPWQEQDQRLQSPIWKRIIYFFIRPLLTKYASLYLSQETLFTIKPSFVLPGRGMPIESRRIWATKNCDISNSTILVQGTGTGWDVLSWARLKPKKIIAIDCFEFETSWNEIRSYCQEALQVNVEFYQCPLENISFLGDCNIDICVSDAVFEHCQNLGAVLKESFRVLKSGGTLYASYGPLWFSAGGDHFSGRGGLQHAFNHILLEPDDYNKYYCAFVEENEDFQNGGRYIELDLFSKLKTRHYCLLFEKAGFSIDSVILEVSSASLSFKKKFPDQFAQLVDKYKNQCTVDDFLIGANLVRLMKPS